MAAFRSPFEREAPLEPHSHPRVVGFESSNASHASSRSSSSSAKARSGELAAEGAPPAAAAAAAAPPPPRLQRQSSLGQQFLAQRLEGQLRARQASLGKLKLGGKPWQQRASSAGGSSPFGASTAPSSPASADAGAGALPAARGSHAPRARALAIPEKLSRAVTAPEPLPEISPSLAGRLVAAQETRRLSPLPVAAVVSPASAGACGPAARVSPSGGFAAGGAARAAPPGASPLRLRALCEDPPSPVHAEVVALREQVCALRLELRAVRADRGRLLAAARAAASLEAPPSTAPATPFAAAPRRSAAGSPGALPPTLRSAFAP